MRWPWRKPLAVDEVEVVGASPTLLRDVYHGLLRASWTFDLAVAASVFVVVNLLFATGYLCIGGVTGARPGSFVDAFFFSVETIGTIGYGEMHPATPAAHALVTVEAFVGILLVALTTGMVFAKFSLPRGRILFARDIVVAPYDGTPTLTIRLGNGRASMLVDAIVRIVMYRTEHTAEGVTMYRMYDLPLVRERTPTLSRSWNVMHRLDEHSPLRGATPEVLARDEIEFLVSVVGLDETSGQVQHGRHTYLPAHVRWGHRYADMLSERSDGGLQLDVRKFHDTVATAPTKDFPYPRAPTDTGRT